MTSSLRWVHIGMQTKMRDIGWVYVFLAVALLFIAVSLYQVVTKWHPVCTRCGRRHG